MPVHGVGLAGRDSMALCGCASAVSAEMVDWVELGGGNSGCCGNLAHTYGFHLPGWRVPTSDYSRRHEGPKPVNMNWACAGDFAHSSQPQLRALHAHVLVRLMRGELPMICEFIGQPFENRPVYYWARWNGVSTLQRYSGTGHNTWSHISWWRSRADERAYLWRPVVPAPVKPPAQPASEAAPRKPVARVAPRYPGRLMSRRTTYNANVRVWQAQMRSRGWSLSVDGYFGVQTEKVCTAFQKEKRLGVDGIVGPQTWGAAWTAKVT